MSDIFQSLLNIEGLEAQKDVSLARHTTWKVGGPAEFLVRANNTLSLGALLRRVTAEGVPLFVLGNGSNILVSDRGFEGIVIRLEGEFTSIDVSGEELKAGGGAPLSSLVGKASKASLEGLEFAAGIPGTVGGAVMTNAGAFAGSIAEVVREVKTLTPDGEEIRHTDIEDVYRSPLVPPEEIVTLARFRLKKGSAEQIRKTMDSVKARRMETQPWEMATVGSVFKNPPGDSAARIVEECGLKGKSIGGAKVSDTHANFIINDGTARASDIKKLIDLILGEVKSRFPIELDLEIQLVGFDKE